MRFKSLILTGLSLGYALSLHASTYDITPGTTMVGENFQTKVEYNDTLADIARRYDVGYYELVDANPHIDPWAPEEGETILVPREFILPPGPRDGITVNLAELRLYYYPAGGKQVATFPIGIGSEVTPTPLVNGTVTGKVKNPSWYVPDSIMKEHKERGDSLPRIVPPGPDNPLGQYKLTLSIPGYLIHGTNRPAGIGRQITHGCMRLYPEDIEQLYNLVPVGTPVHVVHIPVKQAWVDNTLFVEIHHPLPGYPLQKSDLVNQLMSAMYKEGPQFHADWAKVKEITKNPNGIPTPVGMMGDATEAQQTPLEALNIPQAKPGMGVEQNPRRMHHHENDDSESADNTVSSESSDDSNN